jgi:hypothetical protein
MKQDMFEALDAVSNGPSAAQNGSRLSAHFAAMLSARLEIDVILGDIFALGRDRRDYASE